METKEMVSDSLIVNLVDVNNFQIASVETITGDFEEWRDDQENVRRFIL